MQKWIFILSVFVARTINAQPTQIIFDHYGAEQGFYSKEAMDIITSSNGLVWITSNDGLARFDSKRFKFYRHNGQDPHSITYDYCGAMEIDKKGRIWLVSYRELEVFDPDTENFSHLKIYDKDNNPESVWPKSFYYDDKKNIMWIGTRRGLYYSQGGSLKLEKAPVTDKEGNNIGEIFSLCGEGENIWITSGRVIYKVAARNFSTEQYVLPDKVNNITNGSGTGMICSYMDKSKILWLGTWSEGLVSFNTVNHQFQQYVYSDYTRQQNAVISINQTGLPGQEDILWLSNTGFGFAAFNTATKKFKSYGTEYLADPLGIKGNTYGIYPVEGKGMWIGSQTGLHYYDFTKQLFEKLDIKSIQRGEKNLPISNMAFEKGTDGKGEKIWFHIPYRGTYIYDLITNNITSVSPAWQTYTGVADEFKTFFIDSQDILWVSSGRAGLTAFDLKKNKSMLPRYDAFTEDWRWVNSFAESREKIWLGTFNGLFLANNRDFIVTEVTKLNEELRRNKLSLAIEAVVTDDKGRVWFVADFSNDPNSCIGYFDPANETTKLVYRESAKYTKGDPLQEFTDIAFSAGRIFVSDKMNGIWYFNISEKEPVLKLLNQAQGLNNTRVGQLIADQNGNIWCDNGLGLSCFKSASNIFINYPIYAYSEEVEKGAMAISPHSGKIYSGYSSCIRYFYPDSTGIAKPVGIIFTSLSIFNKPYSTSTSLLNNNPRFYFPFNQHSVTIEFSLPDYSNPFNNLYSWKLEGLEEEWHVYSANVASYTNLAPGTYTLRVKAANSQGLWSQEKLMTLIIKPPFYKRWWFIGLCALLLISVAYYFIQLRISRIKERYRLRTKIAADLHDEIGSTLTSITILSNVSKQLFEKEPDKAKEMLQQIATQSKTVQQNMSDIVWAIRPDNEKLENLLVRMREYAAQTLEPLNITTEITIEENLLNKTLPLAYRKEVLLLYKEAINNIAKHAGATAVNINIGRQAQFFVMTIKDNGQWKGNGTTSGTGLQSMLQRAKTMGGELNLDHGDSGTTVQLLAPLP